MSPLHSLPNTSGQNLPQQTPFPQSTSQSSSVSTFQLDPKFIPWQSTAPGMKQDVKENIKPIGTTDIQISPTKKPSLGSSPNGSINKMKNFKSSTGATDKLLLDCILLPRISPRMLRKYTGPTIVPIAGSSAVNENGGLSLGSGPKVAIGQLPKPSSAHAEEAGIKNDTTQIGEHKVHAHVQELQEGEKSHGLARISGSSPVPNETAPSQGVVRPCVNNDKDTETITDEASQGTSEGTSDYEQRIRSHFRYTPYPPGYGGSIHLKKLRQVFTDAAASAKATREQERGYSEGEPFYKVSVHKTRFERYEELMTELFGPGDVMRGTTGNRKPRMTKVHWEKNILGGVDAQSSGSSMDVDVVPEESSTLTSAPGTDDQNSTNAQEATPSFASVPPLDTDVAPPTRLNLLRGAVKPTPALPLGEEGPRMHFSSSHRVHESDETPVIVLPDSDSASSIRPELGLDLTIGKSHDGQIDGSTTAESREKLAHAVPDGQSKAREEGPADISYSKNTHLTTPTKPKIPFEDNSATTSQASGSPMISIPSNALPPEPELAPQISYFNVDDWKITLQRFIKGKGPAVSQPDVIAVLQVFTAIESMVDAARNDPVVRNLVFMLRDYFKAIQTLPDGHIPSGDPFNFRARASSILSFSNTSGITV